MSTIRYPSYESVVDACHTVFEKKTKDYGTAWRILRLPSLTDQLFIKAQRIRTLQEKGISRVGEPIEEDLIGLINYSIMALLQLRLPAAAALEMEYASLKPYYEAIVAETHALATAKNHDYGDAWKVMRLGSIIDIILMKLLRIKRIEDNSGQTLASEGVAAGYQDIINYAIFSLLKLEA
jgi:hypothetical protein